MKEYLEYLYTRILFNNINETVIDSILGYVVCLLLINSLEIKFMILRGAIFLLLNMSVNRRYFQ
jgi:hypothetical protein